LMILCFVIQHVCYPVHAYDKLQDCQDKANEDSLTMPPRTPVAFAPFQCVDMSQWKP
jgi:hypothetical protein